MDLNARVNISFARVDENFQTVTVTLFCINIQVLLLLHTKFQPNIPSNFGEMDFNAWVDLNFFWVVLNFQTAIVT